LQAQSPEIKLWFQQKEKKKKAKRSGGMAQVVECLPSKHKTLSSTKKEKIS
jgi:hypothetical protein